MATVKELPGFQWGIISCRAHRGTEVFFFSFERERKGK
jgi:hypothetical protein